MLTWAMDLFCWHFMPPACLLLTLSRSLCGVSDKRCHHSSEIRGTIHPLDITPQSHCLTSMSPLHQARMGPPTSHARQNSHQIGDVLLLESSKICVTGQTCIARVSMDSYSSQLIAFWELT